jgi:hypothetical protein
MVYKLLGCEHALGSLLKKLFIDSIAANSSAVLFAVIA